MKIIISIQELQDRGFFDYYAAKMGLCTCGCLSPNDEIEMDDYEAERLGLITVHQGK